MLIIVFFLSSKPPTVENLTDANNKLSRKIFGMSNKLFSRKQQKKFDYGNFHQLKNI
jgi:hypothetical protein